MERRTIPAAIQAESAILGAIVLDPEAYSEAAKTPKKQLSSELP